MMTRNDQTLGGDVVTLGIVIRFKSTAKLADVFWVWTEPVGLVEARRLSMEPDRFCESLSLFL